MRLKQLFPTLALITLLGHTAQANTRKPLWYATDLPTAAQTFLRKHFSTLTVNQVTIDSRLIGKNYDVRLAGGGQVLFDNNGNWTQINCQGHAIPESAIPVKILQYIHLHYPDHFVSTLAKNTTGYEAQVHDLALEHNIDLRFNLRYELIRTN